MLYSGQRYIKINQYKYFLRNFILGICLFLGLPMAFSASHHPQAFLKSIKGSNQEGEKIVGQFCSNCHAVKPLIELGAPKIAQLNDWLPRLKQGKAELLRHTIEGFGAMPPRGGCFECTDLQLELAILAMLPSKKN